MIAGRIANALGKAKREGQQWRCLCPGHDDYTPSLYLRDTHDGRVLWHCKSGCTQAAVGHELRRRGLIDDEDRREHRHSSKPKPSLPRFDPERPRWLFGRFGLPIRGTPVETYLKWRCGSDHAFLPGSDVVRYWPATPPQFSWPAMVALVTDMLDASRVLTLHFTDLLPDGSGKAPVAAPKRTLAGHSTKGGVIRLVDDAEVTTRLGLVEGIEKGLALLTAYYRECGHFMPLAIWSGVNASVMGGLPVLPIVEQLVLYSDPNPAGRQAADRLSERWLEAGREVLVGEPPQGYVDWDEFDNAA